ncbi:hypothetical protein vseg_011656 [Gypsophila vaccaria]
MAPEETSPSTHVVKPLYALSPQDGTGAKLTHVLLRGSKYEEWSKGFRNGLGAKRKLGFVDGTVKRPTTDSDDYDDWFTANCTVIAWIFNTIEPKLGSTISYRETSYELWEDIGQRFSVGNEVKVYQLFTDISSCKQHTNENIMEYFGRLKKIWDDINDYDPIPSCTCSGCKCKLNATLRTNREKTQIRSFFMGFDPCYQTARSQLLGTDPLPSLHTVYSRIVQEEEVRNVSFRNSESTPTMACAVRGSNTSGPPPLKQGRRWCNYCNRSGHSEDYCWEKHGYPEGRGPKSGNRRSNTTDQKSSGIPRASPSSRTNVVFCEPALAANSVRLSAKRNLVWLVDTGASTHVTGDLSLFASYHAISPLDIGLPDGKHLQATHIGHVVVSNCLTLTGPYLEDEDWCG